MRVLVTGAGGFVGRHVTHLLRTRGHEVVIGGRDLLVPGTAERIVDEAHADRLLHLAWNADHGRFWTAPDNLAWVGATLALVRAFTERGGRRAVLVGSCAEYGWGPEVLVEGASPDAPATLYGACKAAAGGAAQAWAEQEGLSLARARLFFVFGAGEPPGKLVTSVATGLLAGEEVAVSAGTQVRDFVSVDDVAAALVALLESDVRGVVNVGSGEARPVAEIVRTVADATRRPELVRWGEPTPDADVPVVASVERLREEVGFAPARTVDERLAETVERLRRA